MCSCFVLRITEGNVSRTLESFHENVDKSSVDTSVVQYTTWGTTVIFDSLPLHTTS